MVRHKISLIGAGSAVFSIRLVRDLCLTPNLEGSTISLMDLNEDRLDTIHALAKRYADEVDFQLEFEKTTEREESLEEADFVINTALAVGYERFKDGWSIAREHGYRFGGSYNIMNESGAFWVDFYQYRLFESIVRDMLTTCPHAWYIQLSCPTPHGITLLSRKYERARVVGLCHGYSDIYNVARTLGLEEDEIEFEIPGVNHDIWLTRFSYKGQDAYPLLDEWIENEYPEHKKKNVLEGPIGVDQTEPEAVGLIPKAVDLYGRFGVFPIGDTVDPGGGAPFWWYHVDDETEEKWMEYPEEWYDRYFSGNTERAERLERIAGDESKRITDAYPPQKSREVTVPLIESLACDIPRVLQVNVPNTGSFIPSIPPDFAVEIPAHVSWSGIRGLKCDDLPRPIIAHILKDRVAHMETELAAYEKGSRDLLLQLILMDPWTRSEEQAKSFLDDILALPYHDDMREHYK